MRLEGEPGEASLRSLLLCKVVGDEAFETCPECAGASVSSFASGATSLAERMKSEITLSHLVSALSRRT